MRSTGNAARAALVCVLQRRYDPRYPVYRIEIRGRLDHGEKEAGDSIGVGHTGGSAGDLDGSVVHSL